MGQLQPENGVIYASGARTATPTEFSFDNYQGFKGIYLTLDVTAVTATPSLVVSVEMYDKASGKWEDLLVATAVTTTGTHSYFLYPSGDVTAAEDIVEAQAVPLPRTFRVVVTHGDTDSATYSLGYCLVP